MAENTTYRSDIYSPEIERPDDSGGFSIKDTLFGMAKFAIGMAVLGKVGNITSKGVYKAIANKNTNLASSILKGAGKTTPSELSMGSLLRGVVKTGMEPSSSVPHALSQASRAAMATGAFAKGVHTRLAGSQYIGSRAIAGLGKSFYKALPMGVSTYALERAGVITSTREEQPAWYNLPGHVKGVLTATTDAVMYDMGIGGIKRFAGFAKSNIGKVIGREAAPGLHAFMDKHFSIRRDNSGKVQAGTFLRGVTQFAAIFDGIRAATKEGSGVLREAYKSRFGNRIERSQQRSSLLDFSVRSLKNNIRNKAQEGWSRGYNTRKNTLKNYKADYGNDFVRSMQRIHELMDEKGGTQGVSKEVPFDDKTFQALHNLIKKTNDRSSNSMGSTILRRKNATVADLIQTRAINKKEFHDVFDKFRSYDSNSIVRDEINKLQQSVLTMSAGKNIFKTSGGIVDYSMYSPKNMLSSFAGFVSPYFTVKMPGFDKELPLSDIMSLHGKLGKEGLGIFSMRVGEQVYRDTEKKANRLVGDSFMKGSHNLGGLLIDGELFTTAADGILEKADTTLKKMVVSTPYSREALLYKANATAATNTSEAISDLLNLQEKNSKRGIVDRLNDFGDRWGVGLPTSGPIRGLLNGVNQLFSFSPMRTGVKKSVDMILDPRSSVDSLRGDATVLLGGLGELGNNAADQLYNVLSQDGIMQDMARLAGSRGHKQLAAKISTMRKATKKSDDEIFKLIKLSVKGNDKLQGSMLSYASDHYTQFGSYGLDFQTKGSSFSNRNTPLTRRQAAIKDYMIDAFTEMGQEASDVSGIGANMADWLLNDSKVLSKLSKNDVRHLKMLSTKIELNRTGILDGSGKVAIKNDPLAVKKAFDIARTKLKDERHYLESNFFNTRAIQNIGPLGFGNGQRDRSLVEEFYKGIENRQQGVINKSFYIMKDSDDIVGDVGATINGLIDRVMDMGNNFGVRYGAQERKPVTIGFKTKDISLFGYNTSIKGREFGTIGGPMYTMAKRIAQGIGVMAAAQTLDTFASINPLFTGTMLDNGIYEPIADTYVKANMAFHKAKDLTGITEAAKYLEGLMPSSTSTIPGAVIGGVLKGPLGILPGAVINRFLDANNILPEFDKTYDEMKEIYSGRELVPIKRGRFWLFSKGAFEGEGVKFYAPGWYARLKSQYKYTDTLYGSKGEAFLYKPWTGLGFNPIGHILDKYHYEKKNYWSRPYPKSSPAFSEVPMVGGLLGSTIGSLPLIGKPIKNMHEDQMSHYYSISKKTTDYDGQFSSSNIKSPSQSEQLVFMNRIGNSTSHSATYGVTPKDVDPYAVSTVIGEQVYKFTEMAGLFGYSMENILGGGVFKDNKRLSTSSEMWSLQRSFWDQNIGDLLMSCFIAGTKVVTINGRKNIEDIKKGELVISKDGDVKKVLKTLCRKKQTDIWNIHISTIDVNLYMTEKHHFPVFRREPCHNNSNRPCVPNTKQHCKVCTKQNKEIKLIDIGPEEMKIGDYVITPIIQSQNKDVYIDLAESGVLYDDEYVYTRVKNKQYIECTNKLLNNENISMYPNSIRKDCKKLIKNKGGLYRKKRFIKITPEFAYFLGWWLAEGSSQNSCVILTMNKNELSYANKINDILKNIFNIPSTIKIENNTLRLYFNHNELAIWLKKEFGNVYSKFIHYKYKVMKKEVLLNLFKGIVLGDGFCNKDLSGYTSASSDLCRDLYDIGLTLGFTGNLTIDYIENGSGFYPQGTKRKDTKRSYINWDKLSTSKIYNLLYDANIEVESKTSSKSFIYNNHLYTRINKIEKTNKVEDVYDLCIEDKHYYMVEHIICHNTEFFRRFVPSIPKAWEKVNPLRNKMPSWMPSKDDGITQNFLIGDPFTKIDMGEIRLPGSAYNKLYDIKHTFPGRASSLGKAKEDMIRSMIGLSAPLSDEEDDILNYGTEMHELIQESLIRNNIGIKAEQFVYDIKNDISGHIDLIMYDPDRPNRKKALEIKTIGNKGFGKLKGPKSEHISQLNFYLGQMQMDIGTILYVNRDDPSQIRTFDVRYNQERLRRDIADLQYARKVAAGLMVKGEGFETGTGYSWLDRMRILGDVAPHSPEYKEAEKIVQLQLKANKLSERDKQEIAKIKQRRLAVMRKYDLYPTRFKGKVFNPDITYQLMSDNENIKAAAEYSLGERMIGSIWERAASMNTPLNMKLWGMQSPLEHYKSTKIYGSESSAWNKPYSDILKPMATKALASNNAYEGASAFGWIGALGLGGMGDMMIPGAVFGGLYGAAKSIIGNDGWIPNEINEKRQIQKRFDQLKYIQAMHMYESTGNEIYKTQADQTMWAISDKGYKVGMLQAMRAMPASERPYYINWMKETNPLEREQILEIVPEDVGNLLRANWGMLGDIPRQSKYSDMIPHEEWEGLYNEDVLSDIKVKTIEQAGLRTHDFGLGWVDQQRRINNSYLKLNPVKDISEVTVSSDIANKLKIALTKQLSVVAKRPLIAVSITPGEGEDNAVVQLKLMRDRYNDIKEAMRVI